MNGHRTAVAGSTAAARSKARLLQAYRWMLAGVDDDPAVRLGWAAAIALGLIVMVRGVHTWTLGAENVILNWAGVVPGLVLAAALIAVVVWVYWQVRLDDQATEPYIVALATSVAVIGICTEAFSGLTTVLWQQGHVVSSGDAAPSLWAVEHYYLWHLVDAIPLLEVPQTIRWSEPQGFDDQWSGALLLLFKIMVIIPLVRVGFSGYALAQDGVVRVYKALRKERSKTARDDVDTGRRTDWESTPTSAVEVWLAVAVLLVATVAGWFLLRLVIAPSSVAHTWLTARFPDGIHFGDYGVDLPWLLKGVDGVTAAIVLLVVLSMMSGLAEFLGEAMGLRGRASRAGVLVATILTLGPAIIAATAVSIALLHVGWAEATPTIPPVDEVNATVNWYGWHLADLLPILDLPDTMNWVVNFEYVDRWSAFVMLGAKLLLIGLLGWPIAMLARMSLEQARDRRPKPALLGVTGRFGVLLDELMSGADAAEQRVCGDPARHVFGAPGLAARRPSQRADSAIEELQSLFGPGEVVDAAEAAAASVLARRAHLNRMSTELWFISGRAGSDGAAELADILAGLGERRLAAADAIARYHAAVSSALVGAAA